MKARDKIFPGATFGSWTVVEEAGMRGKRRYILCECECGARREVQLHHLTGGHSKSCGCKYHGGPGLNLTGMRFGKLTVLRKVKNHGRRTAWLCACDCGDKVEVVTDSLRSGNTKSCGCLHGETHGCSDDRLYNVWCTMKARCDNPNSEKYADYGGRGIKVCEEWHDSFTSFMKWAIENGYDYDAPRNACTIDRINVNGDYEPSNCRWADAKTQARNQRPYERRKAGIEVDYLGVHYISLAELARAYGFDSAKLERRIHRMSVDEAMEQILGSTGA